MKYTIQTLLVFAIFLLAVNQQVSGQTLMATTPNASPKAKVLQTIGLTDVVVAYHRPAVKDREVWGKLVPYNTVWRAGANENSIIKFSSDVKIEGKVLKAGKYGLHMLPTENEWTLIFSKNSTSWGSFTYNQEEDALRVAVNPVKSGIQNEFLAYTFDGLTNNSAVCALEWAGLRIPFRIEVDVHQAVLANFREELRSKPGFTWIGWNEAANYCLNNNVNMEEAMTWANRSVFMNPNPQNMLVKAKLTAKVKGEKSPEKESKIVLATLGSDLKAFNSTWKEWDAAAKYAMIEKDFDKALTWSEKATDMSQNMTTMMTKVAIFENRGDHKIAKKVKSEAINLGTNAELNTYGYQLLFGGKTAEAVEIFEANVEKHPEDPNAWDSLGEGYLNNKQNEKAINAFKKSLSMNPPANVRANSLKLLYQLGVEIPVEKIKP